MRKRHSVAIALIHLLVIASPYVNCVQIDNELVSKPHSCFERVAIGAMLPFEQTFRKSDTNQLDDCTRLCRMDLECKSFAFGISSRGNGTCQLSTREIDATGSSPAGTIFDPDFDLYAKKTTNCLVDPGPPHGGDGHVPRPGGFEHQPGNGYAGSTNLPPARPTTSSFPPSGNTGRPSPTVFVSPTSYTTDSDGTTSGDFSSSSVGSSTFSSDVNPTRPNDLYDIQNKFPTTSNRIPHQQSGNQEIQPTPHRPTTIDSKRPVPKPQAPPPHPLANRPSHHYESDRPDVHHPYPIGPDPFPDYFPQPHPHYHFHLDHFEDKSSRFPGIYAPNAPSMHNTDRYYPHPMEQFSYGPSGQYPDNSMSAIYNPNRKNGYQVTENVPDIPKGKPCFRRVLAGKRVASHWVRRTFVCERLDDCQQQCSEEKRFSCEGFNYRIDPNSRGQGECELTEVPLSQMDLYSSPHNRDLNLIPHPDYDYYERDRSTTNCRPSCIDCGSNPNYLPSNNRPPSSSGYNKPSFETDRDRYRPETTAIDKYRPQNHFYESRPIVDSWDRYGSSNYFPGSGSSNYRPSSFPDSRPPPYGFMTASIDRYGVEENSPDFYKPPFRPSSGGYVDSGDFNYQPPQSPQKPAYERPPSPPILPVRPLPSDNNGYNRPPDNNFNRPPENSGYNRPSDNNGYNRPPDNFNRPSDNNYNRPPPALPPPSKPDFDRPDPPYSQSGPKPELPQPSYGGSSISASNHHESPPRPGIGSNYHEREPHHPPSNYHPTNFHQKPQAGFVPYLIGRDNSWGAYGGTYGQVSYRPQVDYWGLKNEIKRIDGPPPFNYLELGPHEENTVYNRYGSSHPPPHSYGMNWGTQWTRRPGMEECSAKTSEGFRLHKGVVRNAVTAASVKECEKMCFSEDKFRCSVYSYRYSEPMRDNCLLCDRSFTLLDPYADFVPDRNYDIYSMSDDMTVCKKEQQGAGSSSSGPSYGDSTSSSSSNDQCFIRTIDHKRFFQAIVRDSLNVRSIKDCEIECIKMPKFTCRSFTFRYGSKTSGTIIDNCQLSDWPVRDMDHDRHLIPDDGFDVFERASYGRGCEIVPHEHNHQNPKLCYLGYGSAAKLLSSAIKKIISVSSESECKNECIRYRETTPFKCLSFSYGSQASTFNCEMSDLDQSELKLDVHYTHTPNRDFWLFSWNPWDYTCRDKITSISSNRQNSERRMDIFREPGGISTWKHFTVSGKACRLGSKCEKNHVAGFYSCEIEGGEVGSWDFCCREDHPCGFSRDFDYPWCYVGVEKEQWRSCSVSYVPIHTQQYVGSFSTNSYVTTKFTNKKHDVYHQQPPRPGGFSRDLSTHESQLHPLQYLYFDGPPNSTEISSNVIIDCNRDTC